MRSYCFDMLNSPLKNKQAFSCKKVGRKGTRRETLVSSLLPEPLDEVAARLGTGIKISRK